MKLSDLTTAQQLLEEDLARDPEFRALWEATTLGRSVAICILKYRAKHDLSQTALAKKLGMKQPAIARLEIGETNPSIETLRRLSEGLGIEFLIDVSPSKRRKLVATDLRRKAGVVESTNSDRASVLVAMT